jgi:hypothetical protein
MVCGDVGRHLRMRTMPRGKLRPTLEEVKALLAEDRDFLRPVVGGGAGRSFWKPR